MREIKFRVYNPRDNKVHYDITGFEYIDNGNMSGVFIDGTFFLKEEVELMQYTGLKDKNGKEIYEGDIVKVHFDKKDAYTINILNLKKSVNKIGKIEYIVDGFCVFIEKFGENIYPLSFFGDEIINQLEVIGNIYDNPELLKGEQS